VIHQVVTLILSQLSHRFVIQVSDRLVSQPVRGSAPRRFDSKANKTIVYIAPDAAVSMSYAGLAYIDGIPTDQWIANVLRGEEYPDSEPRWLIRNDPLRKWRTIGQVENTLLEQLRQRLPKNRVFELLIAGWQWDSRQLARPMLTRISNIGTALTMVRCPRHWHWPRREADAWRIPVMETHSPKDSFSDSEFKRLVDAVPPQTPSLAEAGIVAAIRAASDRKLGIGKDCMSVVLLRPRERTIRVRYHPFRSRPYDFTFWPDRGFRAVAAFSPWVIGPETSWAPGAGAGPGTTRGSVGGFDVSFESTEKNWTRTDFLTMQSQRRKPVP
jgi:hypothetical protein